MIAVPPPSGFITRRKRKQRALTGAVNRPLIAEKLFLRLTCSESAVDICLPEQSGAVYQAARK